MVYPRPFQNDDEFDRADDRDEFPSPEFEALAEQLADDARMLAERYPAPAATSFPALTPSLVANAEDGLSPGLGSARWPHWRKVLAAGVLVAAGIGGLFSTRLGEQQGEWAVDARQDERGQDPVGHQHLPAISFQEFTGPEQEAVLDLLEENALGQGSLSI